MAWKKLCCSCEKGGLNIRSIKSINDAAMLKLAYESSASNKQWASHIRARFIKHNLPILYYVKPSILLSLRSYMQVVKDHTSWIIGDGSKISFWHDKWMSNIVVDLLDIPAFLHQSLLSPVSDFIKDKSWSIPPVIASKSPNIVAAIENIIIPVSQKQNSIVWPDSIN